jgi:hypothetical protein
LPQFSPACIQYLFLSDLIRLNKQYLLSVIEAHISPRT